MEDKAEGILWTLHKDSLWRQHDGKRLVVVPLAHKWDISKPQVHFETWIEQRQSSDEFVRNQNFQ